MNKFQQVFIFMPKNSWYNLIKIPYSPRYLPLFYSKIFDLISSIQTGPKRKLLISLKAKKGIHYKMNFSSSIESRTFLKNKEEK